MVKLIKKLKRSRSQKGGAIYTFDLNDKIGGLPAYQALNGTKDGDCPATDTKDLGFTNYGITKGGARRKTHKKQRSSKTTSRKTKRRSRKNNHSK